MSNFLAQMRYYRDRFSVSGGDYCLLLAHYPLFKVLWLAEFGRPAIRAVSKVLSRIFRRHRLGHCVADRDGGRVRVEFPFAPYDFASFSEVMMDEGYNLSWLSRTNIRRIVDLGANTGTASLSFLLQWPNIATLVAVEANARLLPTIRRTLGGFEPGRVVIENVCIADTDDPLVVLEVADNHRHSHLGAGLEPSVTVPATRLGPLLDRHRLDVVDLLKVDIEGAEHGLLNEPSALRRCRFLVVEVHGSPADRDAFVSRIGVLGFDVVRHVGTSEVGCEVVHATNVRTVRMDQLCVGSPAGQP